LLIKMLLVFSIVPLLELALLIKIGQFFGIIPTIILVAITGAIGVFMARSQGVMIFNNAMSSLKKGVMPSNSILEGLLILLGGVMLLTPGLITDITGFCMIIPWSRIWLRGIIKSWLSKYIKRNYNFEQSDSDFDYYDIKSD